MKRDEALTAIRPVLTLDISESLALETFQNEVLRPILKFQNDALVALVVAYRDRWDPTPDLREVLRDRSLRDQLFGMVIGHLTQPELDFFLAHQHPLGKRVFRMIRKRVEDQLGYVPVAEDHPRPTRRQ